MWTIKYKSPFFTKKNIIAPGNHVHKSLKHTTDSLSTHPFGQKKKEKNFVNNTNISNACVRPIIMNAQFPSCFYVLQVLLIARGQKSMLLAW